MAAAGATGTSTSSLTTLHRPTVEKVKRLAAQDKRIKIIVNVRNFGHIRSPYHGLLQARGDAVIAMASDLQDPPEMIPQFVRKWEEGTVVSAVKSASRGVLDRLRCEGPTTDVGASANSSWSRT